MMQGTLGKRYGVQLCNELIAMPERRKNPQLTFDPKKQASTVLTRQFCVSLARVPPLPVPSYPAVLGCRPSVADRVGRPEHVGIITGYGGHVGPALLGYGLTILIRVLPGEMEAVTDQIMTFGAIKPSSVQSSPVEVRLVGL